MTARTPHPDHPSVATKQPPTLRCSHCREVFEPPFEEFFYRDTNGPFGWNKWCKGCYSEAPSIRARNKGVGKGNWKRPAQHPPMAAGFANPGFLPPDLAKGDGK